MYKYRCSENDCRSTWTLPEGSLNGFVLTCPICGKGRGIYVEQIKNTDEKYTPVQVEKMTITVDTSVITANAENINRRIDAIGEKCNLDILEKKTDVAGKEILYTLIYKIKTRG